MTDPFNINSSHHHYRNSYWMGSTNVETDESSDTDSFPSLDENERGDDNETIFHLDDDTTPQEIHQPAPRFRMKKAPMGRIRRKAVKPLTNKYQVQFPARFIEGFSNGLMEFNIPGIMRDYLNPSNSTEVKINLTTPELFNRVEYQGDLNTDLLGRFGFSLNRALRANFSTNSPTNAPPTGRFGVGLNTSPANNDQQTADDRAEPTGFFSTCCEHEQQSDSKDPFVSSGRFFNFDSG